MWEAAASNGTFFKEHSDILENTLKKNETDLLIQLCVSRKEIWTINANVFTSYTIHILQLQYSYGSVHVWLG